MPRYLITFDDGTTVEKSADTGDLAKAAAKTEAAQRSGAKERSDPRVKVASVTRLPD